MDKLAMQPEANTLMLKAICEPPPAFAPDLVPGKGEGQIVLLHGPPGTGKTLTAESVAEYTARPLLGLTAAQLR